MGTGCLEHNICLYVDCQSPVTPDDRTRSCQHRIPAHDRENRLFQNDLDDTGPEPWRRVLHPGLERLLAGLMDVVPELTKPGETQGLIGDPARAVVDHENASAGQKQKPDKSEKTADHASPYISRARKRSKPLAGWRRTFNLISTLSSLYEPVCRFEAVRKPLTLQNVPSIRAPMAAGAIPPPLFFERRRRASIYASHGLACSGGIEQIASVDHAVEHPAR